MSPIIVALTAAARQLDIAADQLADWGGKDCAEACATEAMDCRKAIRKDVWGDLIPAMFNCNERGANLWTRADGRVHFVRSLGEDRWLNICYTPDNYPSFEVELLTMPIEKLARGLTKSYRGDSLVFCQMNNFCVDHSDERGLVKFVPVVDPKRGSTPKKTKA